MNEQTLPAAEPARGRRYVRYSLPVVREILRRVAAGESVVALCRDPRMPNPNTVTHWARTRPGFRRQLEKARRAAGRYGANAQMGRFCAATAQEIYLRLAAGETMHSICADPAMPAETTVARWRRMEPEFDEALRTAREIQAERFADVSLDVAAAATPETAYLTSVRLAHIRWLTAIHGPRRFGRYKPQEAPGEPQEVVTLVRHFKVEEREDGATRLVSFRPDPATGRVVRDHEGAWSAAGRAGPGGGEGRRA